MLRSLVMASTGHTTVTPSASQPIASAPAAPLNPLIRNAVNASRDHDEDFGFGRVNLGGNEEVEHHVGSENEPDDEETDEVQEDEGTDEAQDDEGIDEEQEDDGEWEPDSE